MKSQPESQKILLVITQGIWGGAQRYVFDLATHLPPEFQVTVAVGEPQGQPDLQQALKASKSPTVLVHQLNQLVRSVTPLTDLKAIFELRNLIKTQTPDILHLNSSKAGIIGSLATLGLPKRPKVIYTVHGWVFLEPLPRLTRWVYKFLEKQTARLKDQLIVLSEKEKKIGHGIGIPENKLTIIPLGIEPPLFLTKTQARAQLLKHTPRIKPPRQWIGTIANLFPTKGLDILITAAHTILKKNPHLHFFVIGSGPEKNSLEKLIQRLHLHANVHLVGAQPHAATLLPAFDIFVLPSRKEGLPYTILEALTAQIPIVATAVGGISGLLSEYPTGYLVPPNNAAALADTIQSALHALTKKRTINKTASVSTVAVMVEQTVKIYPN